MANFGSYGNESLARAEEAAVEVVTPRGGAVLAEFQKKRDAARAQVARIPPSPLPPPRRRMTPAEERAQAEIMSVALRQPHRCDEKDPRHPWLGTPLGRFCLRTWRGEDNAETRHMCHHAGNLYTKACYAVRLARGFNVEGVDTDGRGGGAGLQDPTPQEIEAQKLERVALELDLRWANEVLIAVMPRLPRAMEALCCSVSDPSPYDGGILQAGLLRLAVHYEGREKIS